MNKKPYKIAVYSRNGYLLNVFGSINDIIKEYTSTTDSGVRTAIETEKVYRNMFFRKFRTEEEVPEAIIIQYLCKIDDIYFIKQIEIVNYLNVSRQLVSAAVKSHAKTIAGRDVEWFK